MSRSTAEVCADWARLAVAVTCSFSTGLAVQALNIGLAGSLTIVTVACVLFAVRVYQTSMFKGMLYVLAKRAWKRWKKQRKKEKAAVPEV